MPQGEGASSVTYCLHVYLVVVVGNSAVTAGTSFLDPVSQVPDEVEEEFIVRNRDNFVRNLDKYTETCARNKIELLDDSLRQVFGFHG